MDGREGIGVLSCAGILGDIVDDHGLAGLQVLNVAAVIAERVQAADGREPRRGPTLPDGDGLPVVVHRPVAGMGQAQRPAEDLRRHPGDLRRVARVAELVAEFGEGRAPGLGTLAFRDVDEHRGETLARFVVGADLEGPPELGHRDLEDLREAGIDHPRVGLDEPVWDVRDGLAHCAAYGLHRQAGLRREGRVDLHEPGSRPAAPLHRVGSRR